MQLRLFSDLVSPEAKTLLKFFDRNKRSAKKITQGLINYAEGAMNESKEGQDAFPGMEDSKRSKKDILAKAIKNAENGVNYKGESYNQALGRQDSIRDVLDIMQTEQGRKNAGQIWTDYARVSPVCCGIRSMFRGAIRGLWEVFGSCLYRCSSRNSVSRNSVSGYVLSRCCTLNVDENQSVRGNVRGANRKIQVIPLS